MALFVSPGVNLQKEATPTNTACGVHVVQKKKDGNSPEFPVTITVFSPDPGRKQIGSGYGDAANEDVAVDIDMKNLLVVMKNALEGKDDTLRFGFGDDVWDNNDRNRCSVGKYDRGSRQMDCSFAC